MLESIPIIIGWRNRGRFIAVTTAPIGDWQTGGWVPCSDLEFKRFCDMVGNQFGYRIHEALSDARVKTVWE